MIWVVLAFIVGLGCGLSSVVVLAWLEVWAGARVKDRYVGFPNQVAVPLDNWMNWIREKDRMRVGISREEFDRLQHKWLTDNGYDPR